MARDPDTIEREIQQARDALAVTLDELTTRANPQRVVDEGKQRLQIKLAEPRVRYAVIGIGVVVGFLLLRKLVR